MQSKIYPTQLNSIKLSPSIQQRLCCPICLTELELRREGLQCLNFECNVLFPVKNGIPILIDEKASLFAIEELVNPPQTDADSSLANRLKQIILKRFIPSLGQNIKGRKNYQRLAELLLSHSRNPKVLVVGGASFGNGMEALVSHPTIELVESDIVFGDRANLICDAHSLPFADNSFDAVIVQAVLEHVVDPWRCVEEIHRVLKADGLVYAETPFMQQVHMGCYDFTRFTHLGHRRLFRKFEEIDSGAACGPGMALAWSYEYFLLSFATSTLVRRFIELFVRLTAFPLKYLDYLLIDRKGSFDAASAYYFLGRKSEKILSDRELIQLYRGGFSS